MASVRHIGFVDRVFWTIFDESLMVSTTMQNLVEIGAAVSEIWPSQNPRVDHWTRHFADKDGNQTIPYAAAFSTSL